MSTADQIQCVYYNLHDYHFSRHLDYHYSSSCEYYHFHFVTRQRLQEMQSLHDQVEEAERRHSAVEGQVSCVSMFHCTVTNACNTVFLSKQSKCIYSV